MNNQSRRNSVKRDKPDNDTSFEEQQQIFQRSKIIGRTPTKTQKSGSEPPSDEMDEIKKMFTDLKNDIKEIKMEIKEDINEMKKDMQAVRRDIKQNNEEIIYLREEITRMKQEWDMEKEDLLNQLKSSQHKIEKMEKNQIRNNLVVTGIPTNSNSEKELSEKIKNVLETELKIKTTVKRAHRIGENRCILEMPEWSEKLKVLKAKKNLKGKDIYIDSELTSKEREIQNKIRDRANIGKNNGSTVRVGYQKLVIDGAILKWDPKEQKLRAATPRTEDPKN